MAVLQMKRVSICALKKDRKAILEELQALGVMEISAVLEEDKDFRRMDTSEAMAAFRKTSSMADSALKALDEYAPEKRTLFSSLKGRELIGADRYNSVIGRKKELNDTVVRIIKLDNEADSEAAAVIRSENAIESLTPWLLLDIPMDWRGTRHTCLLAGTLRPGTTREEIYSHIAEKAPSAEGCHIEILNSDRDAVYISAICLKKDRDAVRDALRLLDFEKPAFESDKIPRVYKKELEDEIKNSKARIADIKKEIASYAKYRGDLKILSDYYQVRADKYEILGTLPQSERVFVISGFVAKKDVYKLEKTIAGRFDCAMDVDEVTEEGDVPVELKNNRFASSVEGVLKSYGLPKKGEIDPTAVMSVFYIFFFGLMLSDAAYGFILAAGCFFVIKKFPGMSGPLQKNIRMFMYCGISTLIWGILFGSYFGDVIDVAAATFFHADIPEGGILKALWFVPLNDPMRMLIYSLAFGLIQLFTGLGIKGYMLLKERKYMDFISGVAFWYIFLAGLLLMLIPSEIFASLAQIEPGSMPPAVSLAGKILSVIGGAGLVIFTARDKKNVVLRLGLGLYEVYNVTGWLSDVLSYSRLLALGLATGVIASVVNQMASMFGDGIVGTLVFIAVFVIGHTFNLAINLLGAYVHTNRLQYVEFFSKFYEGGGREFVPFKPNTKYVEIKEETKV